MIVNIHYYSLMEYNLGSSKKRKINSSKIILINANNANNTNNANKANNANNANNTINHSILNIIELKEDAAILKTDIKHLVKAVDRNTQALTTLSDQIAYSSPTQHHPFDIADTLALNKNVIPAKLERNWENDSE